MLPQNKSKSNYVFPCRIGNNATTPLYPPDHPVHCLVDGKATSRAFPVDIDRTKTVDHLKGAIGPRSRLGLMMSPRMSALFGAVSVPDADNANEILILLDNVHISWSKKKLGPVTRLSKMFPTTFQKKTIHILLQLPPLTQGSVLDALASSIPLPLPSFIQNQVRIVTFINNFTHSAEQDSMAKFVVAMFNFLFYDLRILSNYFQTSPLTTRSSCMAVLLMLIKLSTMRELYHSSRTNMCKH